jgi:hypothetical protein
MGSKVPGLDAGLDAVRARLTARQSASGGFGGDSKPGRGRAASAVACAVLALSLGKDPADGPALERAAQTLVSLSEMGPLPGGWVQGFTTRAMALLVQDGRKDLLGPDPIAVIPSRPVGLARDARDPRVSEAFASAVREALGAPPSTLPDEILAKVLDEGVEWSGAQTDVGSMTLQAWLAARRTGGNRWFAEFLPVIERAISPDGTVPGEYYGYPVSRTACALLILWEGWELRPPGAP